MDAISKFSFPIFLFLLTLVFGFWLSKVGKPYNGALFNIHKLIALGAVVFAVIQISKTGVIGLPLLIALVVAAVCVIALFVSGAFLSIGNVEYQVAKTVHNVAMASLIVSLTISFYFLTQARITLSG